MALFAVREALGCPRHVVALHALTSEMYCRTIVAAMLTRLSKQHLGVAEWAKISTCASKSHSQAHKLRFFSIGQSPSLPLSKPKNCWLVADVIWSPVSGAEMPEYAEPRLILRLLTQNSSRPET